MSTTRCDPALIHLGHNYNTMILSLRPDYYNTLRANSCARDSGLQHTPLPANARLEAQFAAASTQPAPRPRSGRGATARSPTQFDAESCDRRRRSRIRGWVSVTKSCSWSVSSRPRPHPILRVPTGTILQASVQKIVSLGLFVTPAVVRSKWHLG